MEKIHPLAIPVLILAAIFGGLAPIFAKLALREFSPLSIVSIRFIIAFLILLLATKPEKLWPLKKDLARVFVLGLLFSGNIFAFIIGLQYTTAIMSQLMYLLVPLFALILSWIFLKEKFKVIQGAGILLGMIGAGLIISRSFKGGEEIISSLGTLKGNLIIISAAVSWSGYLILVKSLGEKYSSLALTCFSFLVTALISLPFFILEISKNSWIKGEPTIMGVLGIAVLIIVNSVLMHFFYQWGTKHSTPFTAASVVYLGPLTAALVAIPLFGEKITLTLLISTAFIFLGFYLANIYPLLLKRKLKRK